MSDILSLASDPIIVDQSIPEIGLLSRNTPHGPEKSLVDRFLSIYLKKLHSDSLKNLVFIEPHVNNAYPDIVLVRYSNANKCLWNENHLNLTDSHFKVLFEINRRNTISVHRLSKQIGIEQSIIKRIIDELAICNLVITNKQSVLRIPPSSFFCIKKIICFEAKIAKWSEAISQALLNTRFATESYILMDCKESTQEMVSRCRELGIGIFLMNGRIHKDLPAQKQSQPVTYTSYVINEILLRIENMGGLIK